MLFSFEKSSAQTMTTEKMIAMTGSASDSQDSIISRTARMARSHW